MLVFGGGPQNMTTVDNILNRNFRAEAEKRGYIVIASAAPGGKLFFMGGERVSGFSEDDSRRLQDPRRQIPHRRSVERRDRIAPRRSRPSRILHLRHRVSRLHVGPDRGEARGDQGPVLYYYVGEHDPYRWHDEMEGEAEFSAPKARSRATAWKRISRTGSRPSPTTMPTACSRVSSRLTRGVVHWCGQIE